MRGEPSCDVSVIIPFGDDEERVGTLAQRAAAHLREMGLRFELVAVDEDSGDNSMALLNLLVENGCLPELRIVAAEPGGGFAAGARVARGRVLWLLDPAHADAPFAPFARAHARVSGDQADVIVFKNRFVVCRRTRAWQALDGARGRGEAWQQKATRRAAAHKLRIEHPNQATPSSWAARVLGVLPLVRRS